MPLCPEKALIGRTVFRGLGIAAAGMLLLLPARPAVSEPRGASVVRGRVQISQAGDLTTIHASHNSIINYRSFDIAAGQTVQFIQPSASSRVLNRITTPVPTHIDGTLLANGQVYIVNRAGVIFGKSCVVDAAGIIAAAANLSNRDYVAGVDHFTGAAGAVVNEGSIRADRVCLVGRTVENAGSIVAEEGTIALAGGKDIYIGRLGENVYVKLDTAAAPPSAESDGASSPLGAGDVFSLAVRHTGESKARQIVVASGREGAVEISGWLEAVNHESQRGGTIRVVGGRITLDNATLDASGPNGGGAVLIGGDLASTGDAPEARQVLVGPGAVLRADATARGDGGRVVVRAEDAAGVYGRISAHGGPEGGNGGLAETSAGWLDLASTPDLSAPSGLGGTWLIDPHDVEIVDDGLPFDPQGQFLNYWTYVSSAGLTRIPFSTLLLALHQVRTVAVMTGPGGSGKGDITWNAIGTPIDLDFIGSPSCPPGSRRLMLVAHNDIIFHAWPTVEPSDVGTFQLVLVPDCDGWGGGRVRFDLQGPTIVPPPEFASGTVEHWLRKPLPADAPSSVMDVVIVTNTGAAVVDPGSAVTIARMAGEGADSDEFWRLVRHRDYGRAMRAGEEMILLARRERIGPTTQPIARGPAGRPRPADGGEAESAGGGPTSRPAVAAGTGPRAPGRANFLAGDWLALYLYGIGDRTGSPAPGSR